MRVRSAMRALRGAGLAAVVVAMVVGATACGGDDSSSSDATNTTTTTKSTATTRPTTTTQSGATSLGDVDLSGQTFVSTKVTGHQLVPGTTVTIEFPTRTELSATAGCNSMGGGFSFEDDALVVANMHTTLMGCPSELAAQEDWLTQFLSSKPKAALDGKNLTLTGTDASITLEGVQMG